MKVNYLILALFFGSITVAFSQGNGNCTVCCPLDVDSYADCVDFEDYTEGPLTAQETMKFTFFFPLSSNAFVKEFPSGTDNQCVYFGDIVYIWYNIDRQLTADIAARLEWKINVSSGKGAYWTLVTDNSQTPPLDIVMDSLVARVYGVQNGEKIELAEFDYQEDVWTTFVITSNPKADIIEFWVDGKFKCRVTDVSDGISYLNFYGFMTPTENGFYIDDLCYQETNPDIACTLEYNPVCVNNKTYVNACFAYIDGYTECEYVPGECTTSTLETSQTLPIFYPNPSHTGHFYTLDQNIEYSNLISANGQSFDIVFHQGSIDLSHLSCGVYILSGTKDQVPFRVKLVLVE
jgi:hypothetical protein